MKGKALVGSILALAVSACPVAASLSFAAGPGAEHSCCPSGGAPRDESQPASPVDGDCCLRAPANAPASAPAPTLQSASLGFDRPLLKTGPVFAVDAPDLSPPRAPASVDSRSPRAPPVAPA